MSAVPDHLLAYTYQRFAREYLESLPLEHFMEATVQATQRKITLASFDVVHLRRPDIQAFNELLVQFPRKGQRRPIQVVPDNMIVVHPEPIRAESSYDVPIQPAKPFMMLEYVSKSSERKDYEENLVIYERQLKVPYYVLFYPDINELTVFQLKGRGFRAIRPLTEGHHPIPELEMDVALHDGWLRFWFRGELIPLTGELQTDLDRTRKQLNQQRKRAEAAERLAEASKREAEAANQRAADAERQLAELQARLRDLDR